MHYEFVRVSEKPSEKTDFSGRHGICKENHQIEPELQETTSEKHIIEE